MNELIQWLKDNRIIHRQLDSDVIEIAEFGKMFVEDTSKLNSIFRKDKDGELEFNCMEQPEILMDEDINYVAFKFGDNWYYTDLRKEFSLNILKYIGQREPSSSNIKLVNLGVHTPYELLNGSFMPNMWVKKALWLGHNALGICDYNTMAACFVFQKECEAAGITPIFGYSLTIDDGENKVGAKIYSQSQRGLRNLLRIQKAIMVDSEDHTISLYELLERGEGNVIVFDKYSSYWLAEVAIEPFLNHFEQVYYQIDLNEYKAERIDIRVLESTKYYFDNLYRTSPVRPILITDNYYLDKTDAKNKIILNKIAEGAAHEQSDEQYFKDVDEQFAQFVALFDENKWDIPAIFKECCDNTLVISEGAKARFEHDRNFMPRYDMTNEEKQRYGTVHNMFNELLEDGLQRLAPPDRIDEYRKQMEYEKYIIESTNNVDYLLVQYDTVNWCRDNGILVGCGRGSAAGSLLLYLLGITLVDPIKFNLIFERFLLPERAGLYPADTTIIGEDMESINYVEVTFENGKMLKIDRDAQLMVKRDGEEQPIKIYADELQSDDDILFDNKDFLFTINEL